MGAVATGPPVPPRHCRCAGAMVHRPSQWLVARAVSFFFSFVAGGLSPPPVVDNSAAASHGWARTRVARAMSQNGNHVSKRSGKGPGKPLDPLWKKGPQKSRLASSPVQRQLEMGFFLNPPDLGLSKDGGRGARRTKGSPPEEPCPLPSLSSSGNHIAVPKGTTGGFQRSDWPNSAQPV